MGFSPSKRCIGILTPHNSKLVRLLFLVTTFFACIKILRVTAFLLREVLRDNSPSAVTERDGARTWEVNDHDNET